MDVVTVKVTNVVVARTRKWAKKAHIHSVTQYVHGIVYDIVSLIVYLNRESDLATFQTAYNANNRLELQQLFERIVLKDILHKPDTGSAGQVGPEDLADVVLSGNIREQMTLIMNFAMKGCYIIWELIGRFVKRPCNANLPDFIDVDALKQRTKRIGTFVGASNPKTLYKTIADLIKAKCVDHELCITNTRELPCLRASLSKEGEVTLTRMTFPEKTLRIQSPAAQSSHRLIERGDVYPKLSPREIGFMKLNAMGFLAFFNDFACDVRTENMRHADLNTRHAREYPKV